MAWVWAVTGLPLRTARTGRPGPNPSSDLHASQGCGWCVVLLHTPAQQGLMLGGEGVHPLLPLKVASQMPQMWSIAHPSPLHPSGQAGSATLALLLSPQPVGQLHQERGQRARQAQGPRQRQHQVIKVASRLCTRARRLEFQFSRVTLCRQQAGRRTSCTGAALCAPKAS